MKLKKTDKLLKRPEFLATHGRNHRLVGRLLCIDYRVADRLRFGISASKRFGNAPERNRFKRLVREVFRTERSRLPSNLECNIIPRERAKEAKMGDLRDEVLRLFQEKI